MIKDKLNKEKMDKLIAQILKFAVVGGLSFVIDFIVTLIVDLILTKSGMHILITNGINNAFGAAISSPIPATAVSATIGSIFGFCISLIFNYIMSMKFVFARKDDMDRKKEFGIFLILSLFGLILNSVIMFVLGIVCNGMMPEFTQSNPSIVTAGTKIIATGIVMVYNFISRKLTLEKKD